MTDYEPDDLPRERWRCARCKRFVSPATETVTARYPVFTPVYGATGEDVDYVQTGEWATTVHVMRCRSCDFLTEVN